MYYSHIGTYIDTREYQSRCPEPCIIIIIIIIIVCLRTIYRELQDDCGRDAHFHSFTNFEMNG